MTPEHGSKSEENCNLRSAKAGHSSNICLSSPNCANVPARIYSYMTPTSDVPSQPDHRPFTTHGEQVVMTLGGLLGLDRAHANRHACQLGCVSWDQVPQPMSPVASFDRGSCSNGSEQDFNDGMMTDGGDGWYRCRVLRAPNLANGHMGLSLQCLGDQMGENGRDPCCRTIRRLSGCPATSLCRPA